MAKLKRTYSTHTNGKSLSDSAKPTKALEPTTQTLSGAAISFDSLPNVWLVVPEQTNLNETARILGEIVRQLILRAVALTDQQARADERARANQRMEAGPLVVTTPGEAGQEA